MGTNASQVTVVTLAVYLLDGHLHPVDTEDAAIKANEIAPGRFTWRKYPDQVNLELVRVYLSAAKREEYGRLVSGSGRSGWTLTPAGKAWAESEGTRLLGGTLGRRRSERSGGSVDEARWQRERARVLASEAWAKWQLRQNDKITLRDAEAVFRIDTYAVGRTRHLKVARITETFGDDPELAPFIAALRQLVLDEEMSAGHE
jgi:hypothetical protein